MGLYGVFKFFLHRTIEILVICLLIVFIPNLPPDAKISTPYKLAPIRPFDGKLSLNNKLEDVELWHKGDMIGPEAFADFNGQLYTTLHGGDVVKLVGNHITPVVKFGKPCKGIHQEEICGRPLGLVFDKTGTLYVSDAYYGVYKVDVNTGSKIRLISVGEEIDGKKVTLPNSVAVSSNGDIFWTDSSTDFSLQDGIFDLLADGSGRLVHYDQKTKRNTVLIKDLHFANGVILSDDEEFVLVSETARGRLHRYYLKGSKKGTADIFIEGLPGLTDNLNSDGKGGFLVPLVVAADADHPGFTHIFGPWPLLRKLIARSLGLVQLAFKAFNKVYPNDYAQRGVHFIGHFTMGSFLYPARTTILRVSKTGEVLDSLHSLNKKITGISEAHIFKDTLYLGSPFNDYIARISLDKIGWGDLKTASATTPKPTQAPTTTTTTTTTTTPKPTTTTTTTPKPTTTTTTPKPITTTTTPKPITTTTTPKLTTTTTTPRPTTTTTTPKPTTTTQKPTAKPTQAPPPPTPTTPAPKQTTQQAPVKPTNAPASQTQKAESIKDQTKSIPAK